MPPKPNPPPLHTVQETQASTQAAVASSSKTTPSLPVTRSKSSSVAQTPQSATKPLSPTDPSAPCAGHSHVYDFAEYQDLYHN